MSKYDYRKRWYPAGTFEGDKPFDVSNSDLAFPAGVTHLMPPAESLGDIPSAAAAFVNKWFFDGVDTDKLKAKDGIDEESALRHIATIMRSFEPKHQYKEAACAVLLDRWFKRESYAGKA